MSNEKKIVAWFIAKKSLIKFQNEDDTYTVAKNVIKVIEEKKITVSKGDDVEVVIENEEVTFMKKADVEVVNKESKENKKEVVEKKNEKVEEKETVEMSETLTYIVEGVFEDKDKVKSIKFKDEKINGKKWTKLSSELGKETFDSLGLVANNEVTFVLSDNIITEIVNVKVPEKKVEKEEPKKSESTQTTTKHKTNATGSSIERQCAMKGAVELVKILIDTKAIDNSDIKTVIADLTSACYKAIQEA